MQKREFEHLYHNVNNNNNSQIPNALQDPQL